MTHTDVRTERGTIAEVMCPLLSVLVSADAPMRFEFWDDSAIGPEHAVATTITLQ